MTTAAPPNAEMIRYWNEAAGPAWVAMQERLDAQVGPLGERALASAAPAPGERVLEVGCGCGGTTLEIARRVGPGGRVLALDISAPMLARARERAGAAGLGGAIEWRREDAQVAALPAGAFDCVYSRFGVMFFADPPAAFTNLRRALRPGGRLAFVCWQARERNPWMTVPALAAMQHVAFPPPPPPEAPGPFAFADPERVRGILAKAGFAELAIEPHEVAMQLGAGNVEDALELFLVIGPVGQALREAQAGPEVRARVEEALRTVFERFRTPHGVEAPAAAWIVTARNPG
ncbi:MAG: methyltransferase domain-containing protein [Deltaproteobacteria bacterium]|nr:methyltransferase domain-containing protein [Deltaproteobacteria bacterium]